MSLRFTMTDTLLKRGEFGAGEMAQCFRALATLAEKGPEFSSQHPHGSSQLLELQLQRIPPALLVSRALQKLWYTYTYAGKTLTHIKFMTH